MTIVCSCDYFKEYYYNDNRNLIEPLLIFVQVWCSFLQ